MGLYVYLQGSIRARITKGDYLLAKSAFHGVCGPFRNIGSSVVNFGILIRLLKNFIQSNPVTFVVLSISDWSVYIDVKAR
jgi:hypothetical protein